MSRPRFECRSVFAQNPTAGFTRRFRQYRAPWNRALHVIALTQTQFEPRAVRYLERKRAEGKTGREAMRCLKRRLSDVVYRQLLADVGAALDT